MKVIAHTQKLAGHFVAFSSCIILSVAVASASTEAYSRELLLSLKARDVEPLGLDWKAVVTSCSKILEDKSRPLTKEENYRLYSLRGKAHEVTQQFAEAARDYDVLVGLRPQDPDPLYRKAVALLSVDKVSAGKLLEQLLKDYPNYADTYHTIGVVYFALGNHPEAIRALSKAIELQPTSADAYYARAAAFAARFESERALDDINKCISLSPLVALENNPEHLYNLQGVVYLQQGKADLALDSFTIAKKINPKSVATLNGLWQCYWSQKRYDACIHLAGKHLQQHSTSHVPYVQLGVSLSMLGRHDEAINQLKRARELEPKRLELGAFVGLAFSRKGDHTQAFKEWDAVLAQDERHIATVSWKALLLATCPQEEHRNGKKAQELIVRLKDVPAGEQGRCFLVESAVLAENGLTEQALAVLEKARKVIRKQDAYLNSDLDLLADAYKKREAFHRFASLEIARFP